MVDVVLGLPGAPRRDRVLDPLGDALGRQRVRRGPLRRRPLQREPDPFTSRDRERRAHRRVLERALNSAAEHHLVRTPERPSTGLGLPEQRLDQPVLGPRRQLQLEFDLTGDALDQAEQQVRGAHPELVVALSFGERHRVGQFHRAGLGRERRLDHQGAVDVAALAAVLARRPDLPMAARRVEDLREYGRAVVARQAQPADGPVAVDQRRGIAVRQEPVGGDRLKAARLRLRWPCPGSGMWCSSVLRSWDASVEHSYDDARRPLRLSARHVRQRPRGRLFAVERGAVDDERIGLIARSRAPRAYAAGRRRRRRPGAQVG